jgi:hypothetical protein
MTIQFKAFDVREERTNVPTPTQFRMGRNPSYVDSLIAGVISPIIHLPQILWFNSFWPFIKSLWSGVQFIFLSVGAGVTGQANGFRTVEVKERDLTEEEKQTALDDMLRGSGFIAVNVNRIGGPRPRTPAEDAALDSLLAGDKEDDKTL